MPNEKVVPLPDLNLTDSKGIGGPSNFPPEFDDPQLGTLPDNWREGLMINDLEQLITAARLAFGEDSEAFESFVSRLSVGGFRPKNSDGSDVKGFVTPYPEAKRIEAFSPELFDAIEAQFNGASAAILYLLDLRNNSSEPKP